MSEQWEGGISKEVMSEDWLRRECRQTIENLVNNGPTKLVELKETLGYFVIGTVAAAATTYGMGKLGVYLGEQGHDVASVISGFATFPLLGASGLLAAGTYGAYKEVKDLSSEISSARQELAENKYAEQKRSGSCQEI